MQTASRLEWLEARKALLAREKELTRLSDELAAQRAALPRVRVEKEYVFDTEHGPRTLLDLFEGRSQLLVQHFMFGPDAEHGCVGCSGLADGIELARPHLEGHDVSFAAISRGRLPKLLAYRERMGWTFPWASSLDSDFNFDFHASSTTERPVREHNFEPVPAGDERLGEISAVSTFQRDGDDVFHVYSAYARGLDAMWPMYTWLDRAPKGRDEGDGVRVRRRDEYPAAVA